MEAAGIEAQNAVRLRVRSNTPPPLKAATIAARKRRGHDSENTLVETGQFLNSHTYIVCAERRLDMPMMDMRVALLNPYTGDTVSVIRRTQTVNSFGENVITTETTANVFGVVTPAAQPSQLDRQPNTQLARQSGSRSSHSSSLVRRERGHAANTEYQPDVVVWHGNNYIVKTTF